MSMGLLLYSAQTRCHDVAGSTGETFERVEQEQVFRKAPTEEARLMDDLHPEGEWEGCR